MKVIDYEEAMKCLDEVEDSEDKTYAKSLLEWAINKRTFEAIPVSAIEKIHDAIDKDRFFSGWALTKEHIHENIDKVIKEYIHE